MTFDRYLDPPEYPEPDECPLCGEGFLEEELGWINLGMGAVADWQVLGCDSCSAVKYYPPEPDCEMPDFELLQEQEADLTGRSFWDKFECPHGRSWSEGCDACDRESDFAYDSARERRFFR